MVAKQKKSPKRAAAPARGAGASKKAVTAAEAKAKADAKTPAETRAAQAGNLPAKSPEAKGLASQVAPPPVKKPQSQYDLLLELGNAQMRVLKKKAELQDSEDALKAAKKKRDGLIADRDALVDELLDIAGDIRAGQGRLEFQPPANTASTAAPAPIPAKATVAVPPSPAAAAKPEAPKEAPKAPAAPADKPVEPKAEKKDAHAA